MLIGEKINMSIFLAPVYLYNFIASESFQTFWWNLIEFCELATKCQELAKRVSTSCLCHLLCHSSDLDMPRRRLSDNISRGERYF